MSYEELIKGVKKGNKAAQADLVNRLHQPNLMLCKRYVKNQQDAEECMLDGFFKFLKSVSRFTYTTEAAMHSWVERIMVNECLMYLRRKPLLNISTEEVSEDLVFDEEIIARLTASEIVELILLLPEGYRNVFNLHVMEGRTHPEIAGLLGITEGASHSQLFKARSLLQKLLILNGINYVKQ